MELLDRSIEDLDIDAHGQVWALTDSLVETYRWKGDTILEAIPVSPALRNGRAVRTLSLLPLDDGTVWISTLSGVLYHVELSPASPQPRVIDSLKLAADKPIYLTAVDGEGRLWGEVNGTILGRIDPRTGRAEYDRLGVTTNQIVRLDDSTMMVPTKGRGLFLLDAVSGERLDSFGLTEGLPSATMFTATVSREKDIWIGAIDGLHRLPADLRSYTHYTDRSLGTNAPLLAEPSINNVNTDIWRRTADGRRDTVTLAGLIDGLLVVPHKGEPYTIAKKEGLPVNTVMGAAQDSLGGIYLTSLRNGACYIRPGGSRPAPMALYTYPFPAFDVGYEIDHLASPPAFFPYVIRLPGDRQAHLWMGRGHELTTYTEEGKRVDIDLPINTKSGFPLGVYQDEENYLYAVGPWGVVGSRKPITGEMLTNLLIPENWREDQRLYQISASDSLFTPIPIHHDGHEQTVLTSYAMIDDRLWIGVDSQLLVVTPRTGVVERSLELKRNHASQALAEDNELVWTGTSGGLYAIRKADLTVKDYLVEGHGLLNRSNWSPNGLDVSDMGWVYQATQAGLQVVRPSLHRRDTFSRPVYLTERQYTENAWGRNELLIEYTMLSYRDKPENLRYQTRLEGYDEEWAEWTKQTSLRYTNLRAALWPKTYFMQVRARDYLGNLYTTEAGAYPVTVTPPLYLRWWAILLYLALLGLAIRAYTRFRLRQQERDIRLREAATIRQQRDEITAKNEENETLLKEIHHRVKNNLEVVSSLLELQSETLEDGGALDAMRAGQSRVASMGLLHQKLYQGRDLASVNMLDYISELTESITQTYDVGEEVDIRIDVPSHLDLDVDRAVPVGLIVNELITNSLKYAFSSDTPSEGASAASGKRVQIHMNEREGQRIFLSVTDNGIGKSAGETLASGFGTRLVQLLTRQLEGELRESSRAGLRTEIIF